MQDRLKLILRFAKPHRTTFIILFSCIIITTFTGALYPYIFGRLVDEVFYGKNMGSFLKIVLLYGAVYLFTQLLHFVLNMSWARLMTRFLFDIRTAIFNRVLSYKGETLTSLYSGDLIARMGADTEQFMDFIHWNVFYTIARVVHFVIAVGFIFYINTYLALVTLILTPVIVFISKYFADKVKKLYTKIATQKGLLSSWLFEILKGMQDIKLLNASRGILSDYVGKTIKIMRLQIEANKVEVLSERVNSGVSLLAQMVLYGVSAVFVIRGEITVGGFSACVAYFGTTVALLGSLHHKAAAIGNNMVSVDRVMAALNEPSEEYNETTPPIKITNGNVQLSDVWFSYNEDVQVLRGVSLEIGGGEKVCFVGSSGAGKSTIVSLLLRFFEPQKGKVTIDGVDIKDFNLHNLRD